MENLTLYQVACTSVDDCQAVSEWGYCFSALGNGTNSSMCGCAIAYGFRGDYCEELSPVTYQYLTALLLPMLLGLKGLLHTLYMFYKLFKHKYMPLNAVTFTLGLLLPTNIVVLMWALILMLSLGQLLPSSLSAALISVSLSLTACFLIGSTLCTCLVWILVCKLNGRRMTNQVKIFRLICLTGGSFAFFILLFFLLDRRDLGASLTLLYCMICNALYAYGKHSMLLNLKKFDVSTKTDGAFSQISDASRRIENVIIRLVTQYRIASVVYLLGGITFVMGSGKPTDTDVMLFNLEALGGYLLVLGTSMAVYALGNYVYSAANRQLKGHMRQARPRPTTSKSSRTTTSGKTSVASSESGRDYSSALNTVHPYPKP